MEDLALATLTAMTVDQIIETIRQVVGDLQIDTHTWTDAQIKDSINFACVEVARKAAATYFEEPNITVNVDGFTYNFPSDCISVVRVFNLNNMVLEKSSQQIDDIINPDWRSTTLLPAFRWGYFNQNSIYISYPTGENITIGYIQLPVDVSITPFLLDPRISPYFHPYLKYAAAYYLLRMSSDQEDMAKSEKFMIDFNAFIGAGKIAVSAKDVED
jgi:hypothetical protein